jgi:glutaredoxin/alkylhydroperoxidase family enzyme
MKKGTKNMSNYPTIQIFTKPGCPYCTRAKAVLSEAGLPYIEHDVKATQRNADRSIYASGVATVPQIFIGDYHINGAEDLEALQRTGSLIELLRAATSDLSLDEVSDDELARGAEDTLLRDYIPASDGSRDDDPEAWPLLRFYKQFFGFWPNCFEYMHQWPEMYKLFVYCHNMSAVKMAKEILGDTMMYASGFATSNAHGCAYCQVHSAATGDEESVDVVKQLKAAQKGDFSGLIGPFEVALADLAAAATTNRVTPELLKRIHDLAPQGRGPSQDAEKNIMGISMIVAAFGFLNVFNDLTSVEIEGDWMQKGKSVGVDAGRHGSGESNPSNLDYDIPEGGPSIPEMFAKYEGAVGELNAYTEREFGVMPSWFTAFPQSLRKRHAYLYGEMVGERNHTIFSSEFKHLMMRVSAIARGYDSLAADEAFMAHHTSSQSGKTLKRIRLCYAVATGKADDEGVFDARERAALQLVWISAQQPLTTPRRFVQSAIDNFEPVELVHLITVCAIASMIQRFTAVTQPQIAPEVLDFIEKNNLEAETLALRYQVPTESLTRTV